ncbi:ERI1 exoribonuclease 2-like [Cinclus cinclus]|uniref:ERI1 exoribonuclease 2-like n=1 Tax=Cinclus cinclus TaxID=127875 RepID=UPI002E163FE9
MTTKRLARRLGLARSSARARSGARAGAGQRFAFLIVLDFEATCWGDRGQRGPEISECTELSLGRVSICVFLVLCSS